jgi:hypothetical protein
MTASSKIGVLMGKGRFVNQKLGKRVSRKFELLRSELAGRIKPQTPNKLDLKLPKKGASREGRPPAP